MNPSPKKGTMAIGPLTSGGVGRHWMEPRHSFEATGRICNASTTEPYVPQDRTVYRPGSVDVNRPRVRSV
jgi:hypothetical protein